LSNFFTIRPFNSKIYKVAEVAARLAADPVGGGVQTADPWGIDLRIVSAN